MEGEYGQTLTGPDRKHVETKISDIMIALSRRGKLLRASTGQSKVKPRGVYALPEYGHLLVRCAPREVLPAHVKEYVVEGLRLVAKPKLRIEDIDESRLYFTRDMNKIVLAQAALAHILRGGARFRQLRELLDRAASLYFEKSRIEEVTRNLIDELEQLMSKEPPPLDAGNYNVKLDFNDITHQCKDVIWQLVEQIIQGNYVRTLSEAAQSIEDLKQFIDNIGRLSEAERMFYVDYCKTMAKELPNEIWKEGRYVIRQFKLKALEAASELEYESEMRERKDAVFASNDVGTCKVCGSPLSKNEKEVLNRWITALDEFQF